MVRSTLSSGYSNLGTDDGSDEADVARADSNFGRLSIDHISSGADNETAEESKAMIRRSLDRKRLAEMHAVFTF